MDKLIVAPIMIIGTVYCAIIMVAVHNRWWSTAAFMFSYGLVLFGARISQLVARQPVGE